MTQDWTKFAGALKAVVIVLGVAIVVATALLAVEIFQRASGLGGLGEAPPPDFATATVPFPVAGRVIDVTYRGDTVSLLVERVDGRYELITVDLQSGAIVGKLTFEPER